MEKEPKIKLLKEHLLTASAAEAVLRESYERARLVLAKSESALDASERETLEALTARYARLSDFIFQKLFRTIDQIELTDEGSIFDRLNRMEKRGVISSAKEWYEMRTLRNDIAHEYLIESSDGIVADAFRTTPQLFETLEKVKLHCQKYG